MLAKPVMQKLTFLTYTGWLDKCNQTAMKKDKTSNHPGNSCSRGLVPSVPVHTDGMSKTFPNSLLWFRVSVLFFQKSQAKWGGHPFVVPPSCRHQTLGAKYRPEVFTTKIKPCSVRDVSLSKLYNLHRKQIKSLHAGGPHWHCQTKCQKPVLSLRLTASENAAYPLRSATYAHSKPKRNRKSRALPVIRA